MAITDNDVAHIARLANIALSEQHSIRIQAELNGILGLIQQLQAVDTEGIEPMTHPMSAHQDISVRLRDDTPAPTNSLEQRDDLMSNAPAHADGLFLVPTVIE